MLSDSSRKEVDRLAALLREDRLESADSKRLVEIIRHHPRARRCLVEHLYLDANLRDAIPSLEPILPAKVFSPAVFRGTMAGMAVAAVLAMILVVRSMIAVEPASEGELVVVAGGMDSMGIAVVSKMSDAVWGRATTIPIGRLENGSPVAPGVLELEAGMVQIDFYSGATVILEGPAQMRLESPLRGRLEFGNLWAHVPSPARGFKVETSGFDVVDLGTEFGMRVGRNGKGEVHVLDGEVEVTSRDGVGSLKDRLLKEGEGVRLGGGLESVDIPADPRAFPEARKLSSEARGRFEKWKSYQAVLSKDPDLLVSYTFPEISSWERTVRNLAVAAPEDTDGAIVGCEWTEGRWPGKGALAYSNSSHRLRLNLPGEFEELTMACWLSLEKGTPHTALLHPETSQEHYVHWTIIQGASGGAHLHFSESEGEGVERRNHYHCNENLFKGTKGGYGDWMHLAVVYDPKSGVVSHYRNGQMIWSNPIENPRTIGVGIVDIGNWPYKEWAAGTEFEVRNLNGVLDEFLIMKRAWTPDEIEELWEVGRP